MKNSQQQQEFIKGKYYKIDNRKKNIVHNDFIYKNDTKIFFSWLLILFNLFSIRNNLP